MISDFSDFSAINLAVMRRERDRKRKEEERAAESQKPATQIDLGALSQLAALGQALSASTAAVARLPELERELQQRDDKITALESQVAEAKRQRPQGIESPQEQLPKSASKSLEVVRDRSGRMVGIKAGDQDFAISRAPDDYAVALLSLPGRAVVAQFVRGADGKVSRVELVR
jgi:hypothetical protein